MLFTPSGGDQEARGQTSVVSYIMVIGLVIGAAGGFIMVFDAISDPSGGQQGAEFAVNHDDASDTYQLVYAGDPLDASRTDVLEVSNENGQELQNTSEWSNETLEQGEIIVDDLNATDGFEPGDTVNIIRHEDATIEDDELVSQSGGERIQSVEIRDSDLEDADIELIGEDDGEEGEGEGEGEGGISINVE